MSLSENGGIKLIKHQQLVFFVGFYIMGMLWDITNQIDMIC